jgi:hypothetical protein
MGPFQRKDPGRQDPLRFAKSGQPCRDADMEPVHQGDACGRVPYGQIPGTNHLSHGEVAAEAPGKTGGYDQVQGGHAKCVASSFLGLVVSHAGFHQEELAACGAVEEYSKGLPKQWPPCSK